MDRYLHIVCLDAPAPPDYGGAIDMYYKIEALAKTGAGIHLHYFDYRAGRNVAHLEEHCISVNRYERKTGIKGLSTRLPYIVSSRINEKLNDRLNEDDHPIILEGLHCTGLLSSLKPGRKVIIRQHNNEAVYYSHLSRWETRILKRIYYRLESRLLDRYQSNLPPNSVFACLSQKDMRQLADRYGFSDMHFIPCFIPWQSLKGRIGRGSFCLYHGNMKVRENEEAAAWLIANVFSVSAIPFIIAGNGISRALTNLAKGNKNISFVENPSINDLDELIREAHIHVLPSLNSTGVKLKLLHALAEGRFCISNKSGVEGSGVEAIVTVSDQPHQWIDAIRQLMASEFNQAELDKRKLIFEIYNNGKNAVKLTGLC